MTPADGAFPSEDADAAGPAEAGPAAPVVRGLPQPRWWQLRIWSGMTAGPWFRLLRRHRFAIGRGRRGIAAAISLATIVNSGSAVVQRAVFGRRIAAEPIPPLVIIVGHWRSGTTLLHELMAADPRFASPTTMECCAPAHFLVSWPVTRLPWLVPSRRPMDDMALAWERPQEDEFALVNLGLPSPYEAFAFPESGACQDHLADSASGGPAALAAWQDGLTRFLKAISFRQRRARRRAGLPAPEFLLLKCPPHTARIGLLGAMFPEARFIHLAREPAAMLASAILMFRAVTAAQACAAVPTPPARATATEIAEAVTRLEALYATFAAARDGLTPGRLVELRYEDLVADPVAALRRIHEALGLGAFVPGAAFLAYLREAAGYRPNRYGADPAIAAAAAACGWYRAAFGYR